MRKLWSFKTVIAMLAVLVMAVFAVQVQAAGLFDRGRHDIHAKWMLQKPGGILDMTDGVWAGVYDFDCCNIISAWVDGTGPILTSTTPAITTATDNLPAILYDSSAETTGVSWTVRVPSWWPIDSTGRAYGHGAITVYVLASTGTRTTNRLFTDLALDWHVWLNRHATAFDATGYAQSTVSAETVWIDSSNEVMTLTGSAALNAAIRAGDWLTFEIRNASVSALTGNEDDFEIKGVRVVGTITAP
uniref:Uncharacterized protein n=1 Tax=viral metagenome TaxID=1070528 RepID=A0A6M3IM57_9ZZZZ